MPRHLRTLLSILLAVFLISLMLVLVGVETVIALFLEVSARPLYIVLFLLAFVGAFFFRARRLQIIVGQDSIPYTFFLEILFVSWFLNVLVPARIGEGAQIALLNTEHKVPAGRAMTSVVADKFFDLLSLLFLVLGLLLIAGSEAGSDLGFGTFLMVASLLVVALLVALILIATVPQRIIGLVNRLFSRWKRLRSVLNRLILSGSETMQQVARPRRRVVTLFFLSVPVWLLESVTLFLVAQAAGYSFGIFDTMIASIAAFLSMTIPITPGGFGTYELVMALALSILVEGAPLEAVALPLAITEHLLRQMTTLLIGLFTVSLLGTKLSGILELSRKYRKFGHDSGESLDAADAVEDPNRDASDDGDGQSLKA